METLNHDIQSARHHLVTTKIYFSQLCIPQCLAGNDWFTFRDSIHRNLMLYNAVTDEQTVLMANTTFVCVLVLQFLQLTCTL